MSVSRILVGNTGWRTYIDWNCVPNAMLHSKKQCSPPPQPQLIVHHSPHRGVGSGWRYVANAMFDSMNQCPPYINYCTPLTREGWGVCVRSTPSQKKLEERRICREGSLIWNSYHAVTDLQDARGGKMWGDLLRLKRLQDVRYELMQAVFTGVLIRGTCRRCKTSVENKRHRYKFQKETVNGPEPQKIPQIISWSK